jgi:histidine phosphotransferase ChpT
MVMLISGLRMAEQGNDHMAGTTEPLHSVELLCARLCHDLSGLAATVASALDVARAETPSASEAVLLAHEAAGELAARLVLFRAAWGPLGDALGASDLLRMVHGLPNAHRITVDLSAIAGSVEFSPTVARILLNLLLLAEQSLPRGGAIRLAGSPGGLLVRIEGERAAWPPLLERWLAGDRPEDIAGDVAGDIAGDMESAWAEPRSMYAAMAVQFARQTGIPLAMVPVPGDQANGPPALRLDGP